MPKQPTSMVQTIFGLDNRAYIATAALQGICADAKTWDAGMAGAYRNAGGGVDFSTFAAALACKLADALLAELEKPHA